MTVRCAVASPRPLSCLPFLLVILWCVAQVHAAEELVIRFRLHAPGLADDATVHITGSDAGLGNWNPGKVAMKHLGEQTWGYDLRLPAPKSLEYKYTLGAWEREGAGADGRPLANLVVEADRSKEQRDEIRFWTNGRPAEPRGQITGLVKYHRQLQSEGLRPRDVIVWLPPGYEASQDRYPVLYMHDGQNIVDPATSAFGVDWQVDETCTRLIGEQKLPPLIVVGIYNTPDRSREYLVGETADAYLRFIVGTLKPLIDEHYRTLPSREHTFAAGSSAGGLSAFRLVWEHSDVFSKAICMSPAFRVAGADGNARFDYVATVRQSDSPRMPVTLYLDNGGVGLERALQPGIDDMLAVLRERGLQADRDFRWVHASEDRHSESAWARRFPAAITYLLAPIQQP